MTAGTPPGPSRLEKEPAVLSSHVNLTTEWAVEFDDGHCMEFHDESVARRVLDRARRNHRHVTLLRRRVTAWHSQD